MQGNNLLRKGLFLRPWGTVVFLACLLLLLVAGCLGTDVRDAPRASMPPPPELGVKDGLVHVFLQLKNENPQGSWMRLSSVALVGNERIVALPLGASEFSANELGGGQRFVARGAAPEGTYRFLRLTVEKAALERNGNKLLLALPAPVVDLPLENGFQLVAGESISLFLTWDEENSLSNKAIFAPAMDAGIQKQPLLADLAYVSCPEIDTVFMVRTDKNWVCGSIAIPGAPTYMAYASERKKLYVLAQKQSEIYVVKAATSQVLDRIKIPMTVKPTYFLSKDGRWGYVLDQEGDYLLKIDLLQGSMDQRVRLGYKPSYLAWLDGVEQLAISSGLSQTVYLIDPESLVTRDSLAVGNTPEGLLAADNYLYVAESAANTLSIYDLRSRQIVNRINVGFRPMRLAQGENRIYLSNQLDGTVSLFVPRQQRLVRDIRVGGSPLEMAVANRHKWLYVAEQATGKVAVIDQGSNRVEGHVDLGAKPLHLLVVP